MLRSQPSAVRIAQTAARLVALLAVFLVAPAPSFAGEPPNSNDPCSSAGRNTCGTLGVGFYGENRYGIRWFGDFRGAVAGQTPTFCLDSRFWYASPRYKYRQARSRPFRNRDGEAVPIERQRKLAYAIWRYGRSTRPDQQAAVALYVHSLVGDARPGEADSAALDRRVLALYRRIAAAASRYHGPYRIETRLSGEPVVGKNVLATIRVLSLEGRALANVPLTLSGDGAIASPARVRTDRHGTVVVPLTPRGAGKARLRVESGPVASTLPRIFRATTRAAAPNAQRLAAPASQRVAATTTLSVRARPSLRRAISTSVARPGTRIFDRIDVRGLGRTTATIEVELFGPFATRSAISCRGRPSWTGTVTAARGGEIRTPAVKLARAGFYTYRERLVGSPLVGGFTTACPLAAETTLIVPPIVAGGSGADAYRPARDSRRSRPVRVRVASVGIDAAIEPVGIDVKAGALGLPKNVRRAGWWRDGSMPGAASGTILVVGHVDSARAGPGAFFSLHEAERGDAVEIGIANGRTVTYRVTSVRSYRKKALPTGVYSRRGSPRLVLVTCGGPFNRATGHYRDNIVVTAVRD